MKMPRVRFTVRRLMAVVAVVAALLAGLDSISGFADRRHSARGWAGGYRRQASFLRASAARFRLCPTGHPRATPQEHCALCEQAWRTAMLRRYFIPRNEPPITTRAQADRALDCALCEEAWRTASLRTYLTPRDKSHIATRDQAIRALEHAADILERWACKQDAVATYPWQLRVTATPAEQAEMSDLRNSDGDIIQPFFENF